MMEVDIPECRACLGRFDLKVNLFSLFTPWPSSWEGMGNTIAEDLNKIANIEIYESDLYPKDICKHCCMNLLNACNFVEMVKRNEQTLKERYMKSEQSWPEPIQINKLNGSVYCEKLIKEEVISDDENNAPTYTNDNDINVQHLNNEEINNSEIKIEPEEITEQHMSFVSNGCLHPESSLDKIFGKCENLVNGSAVITRHNKVNSCNKTKMQIKEEPISDNEETDLDVPLECMLCTKKFQCIGGLKAHVIAQHSYKSVRRKSSESLEENIHENSCKKHICVLCPKSFSTLSELMVHEMSHNKHVCYGCKRGFDQLHLLNKHRTRCPRVRSKRLSKSKYRDARAKLRQTALQPNKSVTLQCDICKIPFVDNHFLHLHMAAHHS